MHESLDELAIFDWILIIFPGNKDMHKSLN